MWSSVELREIRVFLVLAEELNFSRTADRLGLTHSRVSQTIRALEVRMGCRLFDRTSRRVRLTAIGAELRRALAPAYEQMRRAYEGAIELARGVTGTIRLGLPHNAIGGPNLINIIRTFEMHYPDCKVRVMETGLARNPLDGLRHDEFELLATRLPLNDPGIAIGPILSSEERVVAVATDHPLAAQASISIEDLADYTTTDIATVPRSIMDAFSPPFTPSGRRIHRVNLNSIPEGIVRAATGELIHPTVPSVLDYYPHPGVTAVPIRDLPPSQTALCWLKANHSMRVEALASTAAAVLSDLRGRKQMQQSLTASSLGPPVAPSA